MTDRSFLAVILAAGHGTRFKSKLPKVLHAVAGRPLVAHVTRAAADAGATRIAVVHGPDEGGATLKAARAVVPAAEGFVQAERLGTAHAALAARAAMTGDIDDVIVLLGDAPLVRPETIAEVRGALAAGAAVAVLGFETDEPGAYGRLLTDGGELLAIREARDATAGELAVGFCNSGIIGLAGALLPELLEAIGNDNAQQEYYITDVVEIARAKGLRTVAVRGDADEVAGVNDRQQLAACEARFQALTRRRMMQGGVTLTAPDTVFFSADTEIAPDVEIEPHVVFGPGVTVASGARIRAFSHLEEASVAPGAVVGPYARLRPGARVGAGARIGNFVEIKNAEIRDGAKVNHLTYIGDATVGARANIGAGTITCNYDGFFKYHTEIGADAFVGSNSALVAPVTIGEGAFVGSGSVITGDIEADALGIGRGRQANKPGWAAAFREASQAAKTAKAAKATKK